MGITEDPAALLRWMVAGPEVARVVHEFMAHQEGFLMGRNIYITISLPPFRELLFRCEVKLRMHAGHGKSIYREDWGVSCIRLKTTNSKDVVVNRMVSIHAEGGKYYKEFVAGVLYHHNKPPISSSIHRQNHTIFRDHSSSNSKSKEKMSNLKQNVQLLGRIYISCVARGGDVEDFMKHENLPHTPALAEGGE